MGLRLKIALLLGLMGAALFTGMEALRSLRPVRADFPEELYARFARNAENAAFVLREEDGYLAVYPGRGGRGEPQITGIELGKLRRVDRAMVEAGLPVLSRRELLELLEDLGS